MPLTSVPKEKNRGGGESFEGPLLPIVLMPFDGRGGKNIQHFSESRLGLQMLIALESVCLSLHPCSNVFLKHLHSALNLRRKTRGLVGVLFFLLDDNQTTVSRGFLDNEA